MTYRDHNTTDGSTLIENLNLLSRLGQVHATPGSLASVSYRDLANTLLLHARSVCGDTQAKDEVSNPPVPLGGSHRISANISRTGTRFWILSCDQMQSTLIFLAEECQLLSWPEPAVVPLPIEIFALLFV